MSHLIETVYNLLWGDLFTLPVGGGIGISLMAVLLLWASDQFAWLARRAHSLQRAGLLALLVVAAALLYFAVLWVGGLRLRSLLRR